MQASAGWLTDPLASSRPSSSRRSLSRDQPCSITTRRESLELGRTSLELPSLERALSCSALPEPRRARAQLHQVKASRRQVNAAAALAVRELEQEAAQCSGAGQDTASPDLLSQAQKEQVEQDRARLELVWHRRRNELEGCEQEELQQSQPEDSPDANTPKRQRELLVASWGASKQRPARQRLPEQKRQNAFGRSTSSRRARRRSQPLAAVQIQRTRVQQHLGSQPQSGTSSTSSSSLVNAVSPDEQLLDRLRMQLVGGRLGAPPVLGFLDSIGKTPVLTKQQEAGLTTIIRRGILLEQKQSSLEEQLGRAPSPAELQAETGCSPSEYAESMRLASEGKQLMMRYNLRLVYSIAKQHLNRGMDMDDMLPEGITGLEKAIEKFEPEKGFRFSTYSHWWIRQHIHRALVECRIVRLPNNVVDSIARIANARRKLGSEGGGERKVSDDEIAHVLGMPLAKVKQLAQLAQPIKSLDTPLWQDDEGSETLQNTVTERGTTSDEESLNTMTLDMVENDMTALLQTLPVRERNVIRWRYGLWPDGKSLGLNEVGAAYGLTQERVRQIEESGLARLRERSPAHFKNCFSGSAG